MARSKGRRLTKDELFETVWDWTTVSDLALTPVIKELRHALQDDRRAPSYIASVYGRGYRFRPQSRTKQIQHNWKYPPFPQSRQIHRRWSRG